MKHMKKWTVLFPALIAAVSTGYASDARAAGTKVVVLFDRSGSMGAAGNCTSGPETQSKAFCGFDSLVDLSNPANRLRNYQLIEDVTLYFWEFSRGSGDDVQVFDQPAVPLSISCPQGTITPETEFSFSCMTEILSQARTNVTTSTPTGNTPLAQAFCRAATFLQTLDGDQLDIVLVSDGQQNPAGIDATATCDGLNSPILPADGVFPPLDAAEQRYFVQQQSAATGFPENDYHLFGVDPAVDPTSLPFLDVNSWQANMLDIAISGGLPGSGASTGVGTPNIRPFLAGVAFPFMPDIPYNPLAFAVPASGVPVLVHSNFIADFVPDAGLRALFAPSVRLDSGEDAPSEPGDEPPVDLLVAPLDPFIGFLDGLSRSTGSRLVIPGNSSAEGELFGTAGIAGDIDDSGCVDATDADLLEAVFGELASADDPLTLAADLSLDGRVDERDYFVLQQAFGTGCVIPPGPLPIIGDVLFGFGNLADWTLVTGVTTLSLVSNPRTEGPTALALSGVDFREIASASFSSALLEGTVTRVALDVHMPTTPVNPFYQGSVQAYITIPGRNIFHRFIGHVELTGRPLGQFTTVNFTLPGDVRTILNNESNPLPVSISLAINTPDTNNIIDNLRFLP